MGWTRFRAHVHPNLITNRSTYRFALAPIKLAYLIQRIAVNISRIFAFQALLTTLLNELNVICAKSYLYRGNTKHRKGLQETVYKGSIIIIIIIFYYYY